MWRVPSVADPSRVCVAKKIADGLSSAAARAMAPPKEYVQLREAATLSPSLVPSLLDCVFYDGSLYVLMSEANKGFLLDYDWPGVGIEAFKAVFKELLDGLSLFHASGWAHGDLNPSNILLHETEEGVLKPCVIDYEAFGEGSPERDIKQCGLALERVLLRFDVGLRIEAADVLRALKEGVCLEEVVAYPWFASVRA